MCPLASVILAKDVVEVAMANNPEVTDEHLVKALWHYLVNDAYLDHAE
jgi:hypothetical protein